MRSEQFIKSFVRLKPLMLDEAPVVGFNKRDVVINKTREPFSFNEVFNDSSQNQYIYERAIAPVISDLLNGYNACVLAYGQTSSGKTFTMKGVSQNLGLIPLSIKQIFKRISDNRMYAKVSISYFEIYNENLIDLLANEDQVRYLELREDGKKNLVVVDLIEQEVKDEYETLSFYEKGELKRKFASNNINFASSRSHTIFKIILSVVTESNQLVESSIYMVDLAGSQSISKTNAVGVLKKQSENINKSLLALTTAIREESKKQSYVNYRNSKLTRILQPCISGNSKTVVICTVKQTEESLSQTINTLKFGECANSIKNEVKQNVVEVPFEPEDNSRYRSLIEILEEQRSQKAKLQAELYAKINQLQNNKLSIANLNAQLQECKHKLFALENENTHHNGLIEHYKREQEKQKINKSIFYEKSQESIVLIENQNKNLKITLYNQNQSLEKKNKKISILQKNQRSLLDKIQKYEKELNRLQEILGVQQKKSKQRQSRKKLEDSRFQNVNQEKEPVVNEVKKKNQRLSFHELGRYNPPESGLLSHPFTIGTVISLSTAVLNMKIDLNHYLKTITQLHDDLDLCRAQIDELTKDKDEITQNYVQPGARIRESGNRSKQDDKKYRKLDRKVQQLKKENQKLKKKNVHYVKILRKCADNNINQITGFNDYLAKNFKNNHKALFEELMQENADDYEPITSSEFQQKTTKREQAKENSFILENMQIRGQQSRQQV